MAKWMLIVSKGCTTNHIFHRPTDSEHQLCNQNKNKPVKSLKKLILTFLAIKKMVLSKNFIAMPKSYKIHAFK